MQLHYVYRVTVHNNIDDRKYYVGKHSGNLDDLHTGKYKTSGKLKENFDSYNLSVKIVRLFNTPTEALRFEGRYHRRLDVQNHRRFFNEQNQTTSGKLDRTGRVTVRHKETGEKMTISCELYRSSNKYISLTDNTVKCKNDAGETMVVDKSEFDKDPSLKGVNHGIVHCVDLTNNEKVSITTEEFRSNPDRYEHNFSNKISAYDTITKTKVKVSKDEFYGDDRYIGIKAFTKERKKLCPICATEVSSSNYERHVKCHDTRTLWVTDNDNQNSWKVSESRFYNELADDYYINEKDGYNTFGFINGEKKNIRYVGRINKELK